MSSLVGTFKLLPDESNIIRKTLSKEWFTKIAYIQTITENLCVEYNQLHQRTVLDSYPVFKNALLELSSIADALRKFGIHQAIDAPQSSIFMKIYADVIHTVVGWNEYRSTLPHCFNITNFSHEKYVQWNDLHIKLWASERGTDPDSKITPNHLFDDY